MDLNDADVTMSMNDDSMLDIHTMNYNGQYGLNTQHHQQHQPSMQQHNNINVSGLNGYPNGFPPGAVPIAGYQGHQNNIHANGHTQNASGINGANTIDFTSIDQFAAHVGVKVEQPQDDINTFNKTVGNAQASQNNQNTSLTGNEQDPMPYMTSLYQRASNMPHSNSNHHVGSMTLPAGVGSGAVHNYINFMPSQNITMDQNLIASQQQSSSIAAFESGHSNEGGYNNNGFLFDPNANSSTNTFPGNMHAQSGQHLPMQVMHHQQVHHMHGVGPGEFGSQTLAPEVLKEIMIKNDSNSTLSMPGYDNLHSLHSDEQLALLKEERSRERNRDHSRKSRLRKKEMVENLKVENSQLKIYQQICEQCVDLIALVSKDSSAILLYASSSHARTLGYPSNHFIPGQSSFLELVHPDNNADIRIIFQQFNAIGETKRFRFRIKAMDGQYYAADTAARAADKGVVCTTRVEKEL